jgi:hypothetical protein
MSTEETRSDQRQLDFPSTTIRIPVLNGGTWDTTCPEKTRLRQSSEPCFERFTSLAMILVLRALSKLNPVHGSPPLAVLRLAA